MTTTITKTVGSAVGRDYANLNTALASVPSNLVTADTAYVFNLYNDSQFSITTPIDQTTITTDATRFITIQAAAGQGFKDSYSTGTPSLDLSQARGVLIDCNTSTTTSLSTANNTIVVGLQMQNLHGGTPLRLNGNSVGKNLLCEATDAGTTTVTPAIIYAYGSKIYNSIAITYGAYGRGFSETSSGTAGAECHYCTAVSKTNSAAGITGFQGGGPGGTYITDPLYIGCASFGYATAFSLGAYPQTSSDYNASDDASAPGTHAVHGLTFSNQVVSTINDFRPKAGSGLINAGTPDTNATQDIVAQTRSLTTPTIGAFEYGLTAPSPTPSPTPTPTPTPTPPSPTPTPTPPPTSYATKVRIVFDSSASGLSAVKGHVFPVTLTGRISGAPLFTFGYSDAPTAQQAGLTLPTGSGTITVDVPIPAGISIATGTSVSIEMHNGTVGTEVYAATALA